MAEQNVTFRIARSAQGKAPYWQEYTVSALPHTSILDGLDFIRANLDSSLVYRHSCHHSSCGTCAMIINGTERLACTTNILKLGVDIITLEPLRNLPLIADLYVDMRSFYTDISEEWDYLCAANTNNATSFPDDKIQYTRFEDCIECGACVSACPVKIEGEDFQGPAALAALNRQREKYREQEVLLLKQAHRDDGESKCDRHFSCSKVCQAKVYPAKHIIALRNLQNT